MNTTRLSKPAPGTAQSCRSHTQWSVPQRRMEQREGITAGSLLCTTQPRVLFEELHIWALQTSGTAVNKQNLHWVLTKLQGRNQNPSSQTLGQTGEGWGAFPSGAAALPLLLEWKMCLSFVSHTEGTSHSNHTGVLLKEKDFLCLFCCCWEEKMISILAEGA